MHINRHKNDSPKFFHLFLINKIMILSDDQYTVLSSLEKGQNVFMTGPGGSGKSTLIRHIYKSFIANDKTVQVCAMTGCAALLLDCKAKTVHSFAGIGLGKGTIQENIRKVPKKPFRVQVWRSIDVLIIDEVSMMSKKLFDMLDHIARRVRKINKPFGGIQLLFSGDFYQICPIKDDDDPDTEKFCFESENWYKTFPINVALKKIFRQQNDNVYAEILNRVREGSISSDDISVLDKRIGISDDRIIIQPTKLFPKRYQVDMINQKELSKLSGQSYHFQLKIRTDLPITEGKMRMISKEMIDSEICILKKNILCDDEIELKIGTPVMCIVNMETHDICNGSQGIVIDFSKNDYHYPIVRFCNGIETIIMPHIWSSDNIPNVGIEHIPLILSWAVTIHKAQGATMDCVEIDAGSSIFEFGQTYVALSRVKTLDGLFLKSFDPYKIQANPIVKAFYESIQKNIAKI